MSAARPANDAVLVAADEVDQLAIDAQATGPQQALRVAAQSALRSVSPR